MAVARAEDVQQGFSAVAGDVNEVRRSLKTLRAQLEKLEARSLEFPERTELFEYVNRLDHSLSQLSEQVVSKVVLEKFQDEIKQRVAYILRKLREQTDMSVEASRVHKFQGQLEKLEGQYQKTDTLLNDKIKSIDTLSKNLQKEFDDFQKAQKRFEKAQEEAQKRFEKAQEEAQKRFEKAQEESQQRVEKAQQSFEGKQEEKTDGILAQVTQLITLQVKKVQNDIEEQKELQKGWQKEAMEELESRWKSLNDKYHADSERVQEELRGMKKGLAFDKSMFAEKSMFASLKDEIEEMRMNFVRDIDFNKDLTKLNVALQDAKAQIDTLQDKASHKEVDDVVEMVAETNKGVRRMEDEIETLKTRLKNASGTNEALYKELVILNDHLLRERKIGLSRARIEKRIVEYEEERTLRWSNTTLTVLISIFVLSLATLLFNWNANTYPQLNIILYWLIGITIILIFAFIVMFRKLARWWGAERDRENVKRARTERVEAELKSVRAPRARRISQKEEYSGMHVFSTILNWIFTVLLTAFVIALISSEFTTLPYLNLTYLLIAVIISGVLSYLFHDSSTHYGRGASYASLMLGIGCALYVYTKIRDLGWVAYLISIVSFVVIVILVLFFTSSEE